MGDSKGAAAKLVECECENNLFLCLRDPDWDGLGLVFVYGMVLKALEFGYEDSYLLQ